MHSKPLIPTGCLFVCSFWKFTLWHCVYLFILAFYCLLFIFFVLYFLGFCYCFCPHNEIAYTWPSKCGLVGRIVLATTTAFEFAMRFIDIFVVISFVSRLRLTTFDFKPFRLQQYTHVFTYVCMYVCINGYLFNFFV